MMTRYGNKLSTLCNLYQSSDDDFRGVITRIIDSKGHAHTLLRLLKVWEGKDVDIISPVITKALERCGVFDADKDFHGFQFGDIRLNITLEDVLFLTGLHIVGRPVVTNDNKNMTAFSEIFGVDEREKISITALGDIARDRSKRRNNRLLRFCLSLWSVSSSLIQQCM